MIALAHAVLDSMAPPARRSVFKVTPGIHGLLNVRKSSFFPKTNMIVIGKNISADILCEMLKISKTRFLMVFSIIIIISQISSA